MAMQFMNFEQGKVYDVEFPFNDCSKMSNGKVGFTIKVDGQNYRLGASDRLYTSVLAPMLGIGPFRQIDGREKALYPEKQRFRVIHQGPNPNLSKSEGFKDPEMSFMDSTGRVWSTGTPFEGFDQAASTGTPTPATAGAPAPARPATQRQQPTTTRKPYYDRLQELSQIYSDCLSAAVQIFAQSGHEPKVEDLCTVAGNLAYNMKSEGYTSEDREKPEDEPESDSPDGGGEEEPPFPENNDDLPF